MYFLFGSNNWYSFIIITVIVLMLKIKYNSFFYLKRRRKAMV